ncbi:MAG: beta-propeller domain-containing protein [Deltaproteobacteria bacterium]|nr:beta-propeller domain-containing protein [Deltaproteobacteria bacterium]
MRTTKGPFRGEFLFGAGSSRWPALLAVGLMAGAWACGTNDAGPPTLLSPQETPTSGQTSFISADGVNGESSAYGNNAADSLAGAEAPTAESTRDDDASEPRTVEEGDIYRLAGEHTLLNLNGYRGLQVIDLSDPQHPAVIGSVRVTGNPVEMYAAGDYVFMLLNNWNGYYAFSPELDLGDDAFGAYHYQGGLVVVADIRNPSAPVVIDRVRVAGTLSTSRLTRSGDRVGLYVVASRYEMNVNSSYETHTLVKSFSSDGTGVLTERSEIDLGGYVSAIQATPERLLVARQDWTSSNGARSEVAIIDISSVDGTMIEGDSVAVEGLVSNKYNMDVYGDVLRVVSGNSWGANGNTNYIETFDAHNIAQLSSIDKKTFGQGESLYATLFDGEKAFFVTYQRVDPFHAFQIGANGMIVEKSQFIVSGWNDFFRAVHEGGRLVGIGRNDENGSKLAVSLYDVTDLENPSPLLARQEIDLAWGWSEASWDDRAFSVVEGATSVAAPTGEIETGLVLLPFSGWDENTRRYVAAVQIFTFSETTLTRRGVMEHSTQVRRSFLADAEAATTANLSDVELGLFDTSNPDAPVALGSLELAPNYDAFLVFGDYGLRRRSTGYYYGWWGNMGEADAVDSLQVVPLGGDVDQAEAIASFDIPAQAAVYQMSGDRVVVVSAAFIPAADTSTSAPTQWDYETTIEVWSLAVPGTPAQLGRLTTTDLPPSYIYDYGYARPYEGAAACYGGVCRPQAITPVSVMVVGDALVFAESVPEQELMGTRHTREIGPVSEGLACREVVNGGPCRYLAGGIHCSSLHRVDGTIEPEVCSGAIYRCTFIESGGVDCVEIEDLSSIQTTESQYAYQEYRYWSRDVFHPVDMRDASDLAVGDAIEMARDEEVSNVFAKDANLYVAWKQPYRLAGDGRPFARYYFRTLDFANPAQPVVGADVNVPGTLIAVSGQTLVTRDYLFGHSIVESSLNKLELRGNLAYLQGVKRFEDRLVQDVLLDGEGHVLVTHQAPWTWYGDGYGYRGGVDDAVSSSGDASIGGASGTSADTQSYLTLSVIDLDGAVFDELSSLPIASWATLREAASGRALFTAPGGILVVSLEDPTAPLAQGYFAIQGWPSSLVTDRGSLYLAAGRYGLYQFDLTASNLLAP